MYKNLLKSITFAALALVAGACAKEQVASGDGETVEMTFNVDVPETTITTKGLSDAAQIDELICQLFIKDGSDYKLIQTYNVPVEEKKASLKMTLVSKQKYYLAFWAQAKGTGYYNTDDLRQVTINYDAVKANDPKMDAFWKSIDLNLPAINDSELAKKTTITLLRAVAQVNFGAEAFNREDALKVNASSISMTDVPNKFNALFGYRDDSYSGSVEVVNYKPNSTLDEKLSVAGKNYDYLATAYVFAPKNSSLTTVSAKFTLSNGKSKSVEFTNVPIQRNMRTNILGNLLTFDATWTVSLDSEFKGGDLFYDPVGSAISKGGEVTLEDDFSVVPNSYGLVISTGVSTVLNLNGKKFENRNGNLNPKAALKVNGGELTINGEGNVYCEKNPAGYIDPNDPSKGVCSNCAIVVTDGGHLIINGGHYSVGTDFFGKCNSTIYVEKNNKTGKSGKVEIYGGTFTNDEGSNGHSFVLNQDDQLTEKCITVYGGTFIGFNPADNNSDGTHTNYVATGYKSIKISESPETWKVVDASVSVAGQSELETTLKTVAKGESVYMKLADGEYALYGKTVAADKDLSIAFIGNGADKTSFKVGKETVENDYGTDYSLKGASATFKKMKIVSTNGDYKGFAHAKELYFEDCTLVGQFAYMGLKASFKNCQFIQESANAYNLQTYTADEYVFDNCTFKASGKFLYTYREKTTSSYKVTFNNCHFIALAGETTKSAVSLKTDAYPSAGGAKYYVYFNKTDATDNVLVGELTGSRLYSSDLGYNAETKTNTRETQAVVFVDTKKVWENGAKVE